MIATASADKAAFATELGADDTVDHTADVEAQVRQIAPDGVDVVLHLAGDALLGVLKPGGRLASTIGFSQDQAGDTGVTVHPVMANPSGETLGRLAELVAAGELRVPIQETFGLDDAVQAVEMFRSGNAGKIAISIR